MTARPKYQPPRVAVLSASRTPIGAFGGVFKDVPAYDLAATAIRAAIGEARVAASEIGEVVLGNVLQAGQGPNAARRAAANAGIPYDVPAATVNKVCGSGMKAISIAADGIRLGRTELAIAGGMESMSRAPYLTQDLRWGRRMGESQAVDSILQDALWDCFYDCHMGATAEHLAAHYDISREAQDQYALETQRRYAAAMECGTWNSEIAPVAVPRKNAEPQLVARDEHPRPDVTAESLGKLRPAFSKIGSVTAGNSSGINDGAAALVLASESLVQDRGLTPLCWLAGDAAVGVDPMQMGIAPAHAIRKLAAASGTRHDAYDLFEVNEAFAAQLLAVRQELDLNLDRLNVNGGAIALGHPIGASGARIVVTLAHELQRRNLSHGVAAACIGGGMGIAMELVRA